MLNQKNTKIQGNVGIGSAIQYFTLKGYIVSIPITDSQDYDLIFDDGKEINTVQVKTTRSKSKYGIYKLGLRVNGGNRSGRGKTKFLNKKIKYIFGLCEDGKRYLIPTEEIDATSVINLGKEYDKYII